MKNRWPFHDADELEAALDVLATGKTNYWTGPHGQAFEGEFAAYTGAKHALTVSNGTTALECALYGLYAQDMWIYKFCEFDEIAPREVIVPCRTFMTTASAVHHAGMKPVLADIDEKTLNVTVDTLKARLTKHTVAVIVVHYAGLPCDIEAIKTWCYDHNLILIEDCAHAHGARVNGKHVGTFGDVGCFSFCVGKIMSTGGEGGMVITNEDQTAKSMGAYRDHGRYQMVGSKDMTQFQYTVEEFGSNLRMTEMQSAIGRIQLRKLDGWVAARRWIAQQYDDAFEWRNSAANHAHYMYIAQVPDRNTKLAALNDMGIPARIGGCPNIGKEAVFLRTAPECPVADAVGERTLALPVYPTMTDDDVADVIAAVRSVL